MHFTKSISFDMDTAKKLETWMQRNDISNLSFAVCHLLKLGLLSRNNGVGVTQKLITSDIGSIFETVLEEQGIKKPKVMK